MTKRTPIIVEASATTTSQWYALDYRFDVNQDRAFWISTASASNQIISIQVGASVPDANGSVARFHTVSAYEVSSAHGTLSGNWPAVRVIMQVNGDAEFVMMG